MKNRPLLFTPPVNESEAASVKSHAAKRSVPQTTVPHLELLPGGEIDERTAQLARLGLLVEQLGTAEALARLGGADTSLPVSKLLQWSNEYLSQSERLRHTKATKQNKNAALGKFFWWLAETGRGTCGKADIEAFLDHVTLAHETEGGRWGRGEDDAESGRFKKPVSPHTIKFYRDHLRAFYGWLVEKKRIAENPVLGIAIPDAKRPLIKPFSDEQIEALIRVARESSMPLRNEAIYVFMLDTGLRASELCNMRLKDLEFKPIGGEVTVLGKGNKPRIVPFQRRAKTILKRYLAEAPASGNDRVFIAERGWRKGEGLTRSGLLQMYERNGIQAGITNVRCSPHTMRHTFAIRFLMHGGNIRTLAYLLGHESLHITMRYLSVAEADAQAQHQLHSPADALEF